MAIRPQIMMTGATDGIGQLAAINLAKRGADLILTARNRDKAAATKAMIAAAAPQAKVHFHYLDLSDLTMVATAGRAIGQEHPRIDVLVHNAGLHGFKQRVTPDGFAEMIAVNYLAPWILTYILRETLVRSAPARIITVGSEASRQSGGLDLNSHLQNVSPFTATGSSKIYGRSKLLDIMFSLELARQLEGTGVVANCLCPGFNVTGLGRELWFAKPLAKALNWLNIGRPERGAQGIERLAMDRAFADLTGLYVYGPALKTTLPVAPADDDDTRRRLWQQTEVLLAGWLK